MTCASPVDAAALIEALGEPALLIGENGTIIHANRALAALLGRQVNGLAIADLHGGDVAGLNIYLDRCRGSRQPLIGSLMIADGQDDGQMPRRLQCNGSVVRSGSHAAVLLRLAPRGEERFAALSSKVKILTEELRERWRAKALLEETLRERELLLHELQHRVKNNMHMLEAMLTLAVQEAESIEAKSALRDAAMRFSAVNAVQQLLYNSDDLESIGSDALIATLLRAAVGLAPDPIETEVIGEPVILPIQPAIPIALILNELLTNAVKHGHRKGQPHRIRVEFWQRGERIELAVEDHGPGFAPVGGGKRSSGIGLVKGLLRQLGGSISMGQGTGARCMVTIPYAHIPPPRWAA